MNGALRRVVHIWLAHAVQARKHFCDAFDLVLETLQFLAGLAINLLLLWRVIQFYLFDISILRLDRCHRRPIDVILRVLSLLHDVRISLLILLNDLKRHFI